MKYRNIKAMLGIAAVMLVLAASSQGSFSLIEINPLQGNSPLTATTDSAKTYYGAGELSGFIQMHGKLYFSAQETPGDDELWVTDGTTSGTNLVKAINPGHGAGIGNLVLVGSRILFMATDNGSTWDLWSTDGTDTGTVKIDTLHQPTNTALGPNNISLMGNRLVFCTKEKLLITDGTRSGTDSLLSIANYSQGFGYCDMNGLSYFILPETSGINDLWRTDGTPAGTQTVLELDTTSFNITRVNGMQAFNGKLYISAAQNGQSADLFSFDGNLNGRLQRIAIAATGNSSPHGFNVYNGGLYFIAGNGTSANIYRISLTDSTPQPLIPGASFNELSNLTLANNTAFCIGPDKKQIHAMELTGLSYNVLNMAGYFLPSFQDSDKPFLVAINQELFFEAYDSSTGNQVFMASDFTATGTGAVMPAGANTSHPFNSRLSGGIKDVFDFKAWGSKILVPANFNNAGRELWIFDPGTLSIADAPGKDELFAVYPNPATNKLTIKTNPATGGPQHLTIVNVYGQVVLQQTLQSEITMVSLPALPAGAYMVMLYQNEKPAGTRKLLIVK